MTAQKCADILRSFIRHQERMHKEVIFVDENGETPGRINPEADILYQATKFALTCVEEKISKMEMKGRVEFTENGKSYMGLSFTSAGELMALLKRYGKDVIHVTVSIECPVTYTKDADSGDGA